MLCIGSMTRKLLIKHFVIDRLQYSYIFSLYSYVLSSHLYRILLRSIMLCSFQKRFIFKVLLKCYICVQKSHSGNFMFKIDYHRSQNLNTQWLRSSKNYVKKSKSQNSGGAKMESLLGKNNQYSARQQFADYQLALKKFLRTLVGLQNVDHFEKLALKKFLRHSGDRQIVEICSEKNLQSFWRH